MPYPAYKLNPGDMFQVDPEKVMYATGKAKRPIVQTPAKASSTEDVVGESEPEQPASAEADQGTAVAAEQDPDTTDKPEVVDDLSPTRKAITRLVKQAKNILANEKLGVNKKRAVRSFIKQAQTLQSQAKTGSSSADVAAKLNEMMADLKLNETNPESAEASAEKQSALDLLSAEELNTLKRKLKEEEANPIDPEKPYMTPWRPRDYMGPFAFIPQYLEVNHNICSAVYLRHPVARVGAAEVPTPFGYNINQLAFNWYLRRR
jgi:ribosomal protein S4